MPWNNQSGDGNGQAPRGPWGRGPTGGGGSAGGPSPDLEEWLRRSQERLRRILPGGALSAGGIIILALGLLIVWLLSGVYFVTAQEQGVVLRFGKYVARTAPGINYHLPWPIETVITPEVTTVNQITIGYHLSGDTTDDSGAGDVPEESLMLTGDENIVDVNFTVGWVIKDAGDFEFNIENQPQTIKAVAESTTPASRSRRSRCRRPTRLPK